MKSGSDYKNFSEIDITLKEGINREDYPNPKIDEDNCETDTAYEYGVRGRFEVTVHKRDITTDIQPYPKLVQMVSKYDDLMQEAMKRVSLKILTKVICKCEVELDTKFSSIRSEETAIGNLVTDLMRKHMSADCALLNAGTIRADKVYEPSYLTVGDFNDMNPYRKDVDKVECTGEQLIQILEAGVSRYPALEGRFPQVSNIEFEFDPAQPPYSRVVQDSVKIMGEKLALEKKYSMATSVYLTEGRDGYDVFKQCKPLLDKDALIDLGDLLIEFFDLSESRKFREEYQVYSQHQEELSQKFIRGQVKHKVEKHKAVKGERKLIF